MLVLLNSLLLLVGWLFWGGFLSFSVREVLHFCNYFLCFLLETLFCHWFVVSFLEWEWPDFHVLLMMYSDISTFLSLLVTELLVLSQIIFTFDMSALCWQVTVNLLAMSMVNKIFSLIEFFQLINNFISWCFHAPILLFNARGLPAYISQSYPLNSVWCSKWSFCVLIVFPHFALEAVFNSVLLVLVFYLFSLLSSLVKVLNEMTFWTNVSGGALIISTWCVLSLFKAL